MKTQERYRRNALAFCLAAQKLDGDDSDAFISPISLCLAFAVELYLKCVLLKAGKTAKQLGRQPFGHDLWSMWEMAELSGRRDQAKIYAESCYQDLVGTGSHHRPIPVSDTLNKHLEDLSKLHNSASGMPLRYPTKRTQVPDASLMICVFERLIRAEQHGDMIERI